MRVSAAPIFFVLMCGIVIAFFGFGTYAQAQTTCPKEGERPAKEADLPLMRAAGYPPEYAVIGRCWNPADENTGEAIGEAKLWLQKHSSKNSNISCMNPSFARKLMQFMQAVPGGPPTITDGYRSVGQQNGIIARKDGATRVTSACQSYHPWGLAADFNNNNNQQTAWMRAHAREYGIGILGGWDPNHFQDLNGRYGQCGSCANAGGEGALPAVRTQQYPDDYYYYQATNQPFTLGQPPMMPPAPAPASSPTPTQTQAQTQTSATNQPQICDPKLSCTGNVTYYQTSSCTTQVYQVCQYGCSTTGSACATSTSTAATSSRNLTGTGVSIGSGIDIANRNSNDNDNATTGPSISELLEKFTSPVSFTPTEIGTSTSLAFRLNPDTGDIEALDASERPKDAVAPGTITSVQPPPGQQTFTSDDLGNTYNGQYGTQQNSTFKSVLDGLKSALMWALNVLRGLSGTTGA